MYLSHASVKIIKIKSSKQLHEQRACIEFLKLVKELVTSVS